MAHTIDEHDPDDWQSCISCAYVHGVLVGREIERTFHGDMALIAEAFDQLDTPTFVRAEGPRPGESRRGSAGHFTEAA